MSGEAMELAGNTEVPYMYLSMPYNEDSPKKDDEIFVLGEPHRVIDVDVVTGTHHLYATYKVLPSPIAVACALADHW